MRFPAAFCTASFTLITQLKGLSKVCCSCNTCRQAATCTDMSGQSTAFKGRLQLCNNFCANENFVFKGEQRGEEEGERGPGGRRHDGRQAISISACWRNKQHVARRMNMSFRSSHAAFRSNVSRLRRTSPMFVVIV